MAGLGGSTAAGPPPPGGLPACPFLRTQATAPAALDARVLTHVLDETRLKPKAGTLTLVPQSPSTARAGPPHLPPPLSQTHPYPRGAGTYLACASRAPARVVCTHPRVLPRKLTTL